MKIGLYFGSFNPIHVGHLIIANHIAYHTDCEQVWLMVSPQNPFKKSGSLLNEYDRLYMTEMAIGNEPLLKVNKDEFSLPRPSYTIDTLTYLSEKYPQHQFSVIMGSDSYQNLSKWKNSDVLINNYSIYVYLRPGHEPQKIAGADVTICDAPHLSISSSKIRKLIKSGKSARFMVPDKVYDYILESHYYQL